MASSVAISLDMLDTANRLREASGRPPAFEIALNGSGAVAFRGLSATRPPLSRSPDVVVVPGLGLTNEAQVRARFSQRDIPTASRTLHAAVERGAEIATSCSGVFLFAELGVLAGRRATTTWWLAALFRQLHPLVELDTDALVVRDGPVTTAGAAMAQMDLMLAIIAKHEGRRLAAACARYLLLDERRSQARYMALSFLTASDPAVLKAERWAQSRLETGFDMAEFAAAAGLSPRTFARRVARSTGLSPVRLVQRLRIERATELIETKRLSIEEVARKVGYAEPTTLRRILLRETGRSPREFRA